MKKKDAFNLRKPLALWSGLLALFSWLGTIRITSYLVMAIRQYGWTHTVCGITDKIDNAVWFWLYVFVLSKIPELGDTFFIVFRKSKLPFLHWYHHITVMIYSFYLCGHPQSGMLWYAGMNFAVHALMYSYYTLKALQVKLPRWVSITITTCQLSQMVVGVALQIAALYYLRKGNTCDTTYGDITFALAIYGSYMVLFADFFYKAYLTPKAKTI